MKTVRRGEDVRRVSDENARQMVRDGWEYCPKRIWKEKRDA